MKKAKLLTMLVVIGVLLIAGITVFAAGTTVYETDFSEANGWNWVNIPSGNKDIYAGFSADEGAYANYPSGGKLVYSGSSPFVVKAGETYEVSYKIFKNNSGGGFVYLDLRLAGNKMKIRTENDSGTYVTGLVPYRWYENNAALGYTNSWYTVKYRFTVESMVSASDNTTPVTGSSISWMQFDCGQTPGRIRFKDLKISRIDDVKTEKTVVGTPSDSTYNSQLVLKQDFSAETNGALSVTGKSSIASDLTLKKGSSYRISYYAKAPVNTALSTGFTMADGSRIKVSGCEMSESFDDSGAAFSGGKFADAAERYYHYCYFADIEDIEDKDGNKLSSAKLSSIDFYSPSGTVIFDDYYIAEYNNFVDVSVIVIEGNGTAVLSGESEVSQYSNFSCDITPSTGSRIKSVGFAGEDITSAVVDLTNGGTLTLSAGYAGGEIRIAFEEIPLTPGFVKNSIYIVRQPDYAKGYSIISYAELSDCGYADDVSFGIKLTENTSGNTLTLPSKNGISENKAFAIRVFGKAITADGDYKFVPYVTVGDNTIYGDEAQEQ